MPLGVLRPSEFWVTFHDVWSSDAPAQMERNTARTNAIATRMSMAGVLAKMAASRKMQACELSDVPVQVFLAYLVVCAVVPALQHGPRKTPCRSCGLGSPRTPQTND